MKHPLLVQPHFWQWLSQDDHSCSDNGDVCLDLYRREWGWNEHMSPNVGIPEYYDNEHYARRMKTKRLMKKQASNKRNNKQSGKNAFTTAKEKNDSKERIYETVSETFGFEHHKGTDRSLELRTLKFILLREGFITKLWNCAQQLNKTHDHNKNPLRQKLSHHHEENEMLAVLAECRQVTANLILSLVAWRCKPEANNVLNQSPLHSQPFIWRKQKYILKMCRDLDFISGCKPLVKLLEIAERNMTNNPLMLPNNIDEATEPQSWFETSPPEIPLTKEDVKVKEKRKLNERRLHRRAEGALVLELYFEQIREKMGKQFLNEAYYLVRGSENNKKSVLDCDKDHVDEKIAIASSRERKLLQWHGKAQAQLASLSHPSAAFSDRKSRGLELKTDVESSSKGQEIPKEIVCFQTSRTKIYSSPTGHSGNESPGTHHFCSILAPAAATQL